MFRKYKYGINLLITFMLFAIIAIYKKFIPFAGPLDNSMLTIDLGQQYIDFFAMFKKTLLSSPESFFYSFEKGMGGEMIGLWAYYILSPFNLILLFFPDRHLDLGVSFLVMAKLLAASTAFFYFTQDRYRLNPVMATLFAQCYTFMSYMMIYLLNIMWIDAVVALPLIVVGLDHLLRGKGKWFYILSLAVLLIAQFYIGYMVCLFLGFYAMYLIIENQIKFNFKQFCLDYWVFIKYSLIAVMIAGIVLIPTFSTIIESKGAQLDSKNELVLEYVTQYNLRDIASKFFMGAYNYDEIQSGSPNLYAGMITLGLSVLYFFNSRIKRSEKIMALIVLAIFYFSFTVEFLDKIWHAGQFPIWYDHRFSFTTSFFMLVMAIKTYQAHEFKPIKKPYFIGLMLAMVVFAFYYYKSGGYEFLKADRIFLSAFFFIISFILLGMFKLPQKYQLSLLLLVVMTELTGNSILIFNEFNNYIQPSKFTDYVTLLNQAVQPLKASSGDFYRIHKTYQRDKNEAFFAHYNGLDHFGSTIEARVTQLYGYLGLPNTSNAVNYTNGTLFTDDFFDVRYFLDPSPDTALNTESHQYKLFPRATDIDLQAYDLVKKDKRYYTFENKERLGLAMEVSPELTDEKTKFTKYQPIKNQELLLHLIDFKGDKNPYFKERKFNKVVYKNAAVTDKGDGDFFTYVHSPNKNGEAYFDLIFDTNSTNPYYFTLPSQFNNKNVDLLLNSGDYRFYTPASGRQITNASFNKIAKDQKLRIKLKNEKTKANLVSLYEFDLPRYQQMISRKQKNLFQVTRFSDTAIDGTITTELKDSYLLFSIPYDKRWKITLDGNPVKGIPVLNKTLLAIPVTAGNHQVSLRYFPPEILRGGVLTLIGFTFALLDPQWINRYRKTPYLKGMGLKELKEVF